MINNSKKYPTTLKIIKKKKNKNKNKNKIKIKELIPFNNMILNK